MPTPANDTTPTADELTAWIRQHIGWTIWETDEAAKTLHAAWKFVRTDTGIEVPLHTLGWALPAASLLGPYPHANEAADSLCASYTITRREA